jgi:hypothetical protein
LTLADWRWDALIAGGFLVLAKAAALDDPELFAEFAFGQCAMEGSHHGEQIGVRKIGRKT